MASGKCRRQYQSGEFRIGIDATSSAVTDENFEPLLHDVHPAALTNVAGCF
jgi:hypothetical protein